MEVLECSIRLAEDQLVEYSSWARKVEKLRQKIGLSVSLAEQLKMKEVLETQVATSQLELLVERQRQALALPFWGITGLGLLEGILGQPLGWIAVVSGLVAALGLQKWGWSLQARRLLLNTLDEIQLELKKYQE